MFTRFQNLLRGCLLCVGVSNRKATIAVPTPIVPETPVATSSAEEAPDLDDQFTAWEQDRSNTLHDAEESEQQGIRRLTKAALLRLVVQFEDEGQWVVAHELRQRAEALELRRPSIAEVPFAEPVF